MKSEQAMDGHSKFTRIPHNVNRYTGAWLRGAVVGGTSMPVTYVLPAFIGIPRSRAAVKSDQAMDVGVSGGWVQHAIDIRVLIICHAVPASTCIQIFRPTPGHGRTCMSVKDSVQPPRSLFLLLHTFSASLSWYDGPFQWIRGGSSITRR